MFAEALAVNGGTALVRYATAMAEGAPEETLAELLQLAMEEAKADPLPRYVPPNERA
jgi:hypothetical protein